jgi:parvulin-like peptidyl-prolyl isomerase
MLEVKSVVVATVQGVDLSLHDLLYTLKLKGQLPGLITAAVEDKVIADSAVKEGLSVSDEELQQAANAFRVGRGLNKAADMHRWLALNHLQESDLEEGLERELLRQKLADHVTRADLEKYFAENRTKYDRARLRHIVADKEGIAQELLSRIVEEEADFAELARRYSLEQRTRANGGDLGIVSRTALPSVVAAAVFTATAGDVVGPLKHDSAYLLVKVEEILLGQLDGPTTAAIQQVLFRDWMARRLRNEKVEMKLEV